MRDARARRCKNISFQKVFNFDIHIWPTNPWRNAIQKVHSKTTYCNFNFIIYNMRLK